LKAELLASEQLHYTTQRVCFLAPNDKIGAGQQESYFALGGMPVERDEVDRMTPAGFKSCAPPRVVELDEDEVAVRVEAQSFPPVAAPR
jgi:hypothetical protein